jgi:molybdopterin-guanine dinucleotide biosynthesis protein A
MPASPFPSISAVILDGGKASRLGGVHKSFLAVGDSPIAERSVSLLRTLCDDVIAATSRPDAWAPLGVRCVADPVRDAGPLAGLAAGLLACRTPLALVVAGDMPELSREVLEALCLRASDGEPRCVVPRIGGRAEPLHAVYLTALAPLALDALVRGRRKLTDFLDDVARSGSVEIAWVDGADLAGLPGIDRTFRNVNTPEDLRIPPHGKA